MPLGGTGAMRGRLPSAAQHVCRTAAFGGRYMCAHLCRSTGYMARGVADAQGPLPCADAKAPCHCALHLQGHEDL